MHGGLLAGADRLDRARRPVDDGLEQARELRRCCRSESRAPSPRSAPRTRSPTRKTAGAARPSRSTRPTQRTPAATTPAPDWPPPPVLPAAPVRPPAPPPLRPPVAPIAPPWPVPAAPPAPRPAAAGRYAARRRDAAGRRPPFPRVPAGEPPDRRRRSCPPRRSPRPTPEGSLPASPPVAPEPQPLHGERQEKEEHCGDAAERGMPLRCCVRTRVAMRAARQIGDDEPTERTHTLRLLDATAVLRCRDSVLPQGRCWSRRRFSAGRAALRRAAARDGGRAGPAPPAAPAGRQRAAAGGAQEHPERGGARDRRRRWRARHRRCGCRRWPRLAGGGERPGIAGAGGIARRGRRRQRGWTTSEGWRRRRRLAPRHPQPRAGGVERRSAHRRVRRRLLHLSDDRRVRELGRDVVQRLLVDQPRRLDEPRRHPGLAQGPDVGNGPRLGAQHRARRSRPTISISAPPSRLASRPALRPRGHSRTRSATR